MCYHPVPGPFSIVCNRLRPRDHVMNARFAIVIIAVLGLIGFLAGGSPGEIPPQGPTLPVFFTGDHNGEVASCGCPKEDYGGVTRLAAFVDTLRSSGWEFLLVDAGDLAPFDLDTQGRLKVQTLTQAMSLMDYQAVTLGDHDLAGGPEFVADMVRRLGEPIVATNYDLPDGNSERTRLVTVRGHRVGIVAFLDGSLLPDSSWISVEPWDAEAGRVQALRDECDLLVALVHAPDDPAVARFVDLYPQVDLVVSAHEGNLPVAMARIGKTYAIWCTGGGRYLGRVEVAFNPDGTPRNMEAAHFPVVETWGRRARVDSLLENYYAKMRELVASDAFAAERMKSLKEPKVEYVGSAACASCHAAESAQWETTHHAKAHATLRTAKKDDDPDCQKCHTVGFGYRTGFATPQATPDRWNVGCESCHGPGAAHAASGEGPYGEVSETTCRGCHNAEHSPDFDYATYRPRIVHASGKAADAGKQ
jgi:2',3'-cyclic-nucleotide 2'-phosphodiesterase (5'-nucleotidase family)